MKLRIRIQGAGFDCQNCSYQCVRGVNYTSKLSKVDKIDGAMFYSILEEEK
jgi:Fe-S-cluster containining protein